MVSGTIEVAGAVKLFKATGCSEAGYEAGTLYARRRDHRGVAQERTIQALNGVVARADVDELLKRLASDMEPR